MNTSSAVSILCSAPTRYIFTNNIKINDNPNPYHSYFNEVIIFFNNRSCRTQLIFYTFSSTYQTKTICIFTNMLTFHFLIYVTTVFLYVFIFRETTILCQLQPSENMLQKKEASRIMDLSCFRKFLPTSSSSPSPPLDKNGSKI